MSSSDATKPYAIGQAFTGPLVSMSNIKGHLRLLRAFAQLKYKLDSLRDLEVTSQFPRYTPRNADKRWEWFVGLAVERFGLWCQWVQDRKIRDVDDLSKHYLPPLDVFMVWHAYMLNPAWYQEDIKRSSSLKFLVDLGLIFQSTFCRKSEWTKATKRPFDPIESAKAHTTIKIKCPGCRQDARVSLMDGMDTGYLQGNFSARCTASETCPRITKSTLGARKLARDISMNEPCEDLKEYQTYLAGTLYTAQDTYNYKRARMIKEKILKSPIFYRPDETQHHLPLLKKRSSQTVLQAQPSQEEWESMILKRVDFKKDAMQRGMNKHVTGKLLSRVMSAYTDGKPWSLDLVGAVLRQGSFVKKMDDLEWTQGSFIDVSGEVALEYAVTRYHANDQVKPLTLSSSFDKTRQAWEVRTSPLVSLPDNAEQSS
ncbi:hypothetical protein VNI00_011153 [Paramarasmius palmivorus]|uniref:Uncharacterized protein n=1 Tax=Paramarasmius palmivorus TaxID=297713 RepID=A0AAW0CHL8_9AGAR